MVIVLTLAVLVPMALQGTIEWAAAHQASGPAYQQTNLVSDTAGMAAFTDTHLINPWGISESSSGPFWVSDNGTGFSTLYNSQGQPQSLIVTIPSAAGSGHGTPTGTVFNSTSGFVIKQGSKSGPAQFLFDSLDGTISGWNTNVSPTSAIVAVNNSASAVYTGLTLASNSSGTFLYAANSLISSQHPNGTIDVFSQNFAPTQLQGSFTDPNLPAGYSPYNIRKVGGMLLVTYSPASAPPKLGQGFVDVYDSNGNFIRRLISNGKLDAPWGLALAPSSFGQFSSALLVGNVGNGLINAFSSSSGAFLGTLKNTAGQPIQNSGLWTLTFGNGGMGGNLNTLYFAAGIGGYQHGLFGAITPVS